MGFFVAAFVRDGSGESTRVTETVVAEDEEWNGFSGDEKVGEVVEPVKTATAEGSEKRKKKKRKH
jgi:putative methyltransferase